MADIDAGPAYQDFNAYHGDTFTFFIDLSEPDADLTGFTPLFQLRLRGQLVADWSAHVSITSARRVDVVVPGQEAAGGTYSLPRPAQQQAYDYDLQFSDVAQTRTLLRGKIVLVGDISHG